MHVMMMPCHLYFSSFANNMKWHDAIMLKDVCGNRCCSSSRMTSHVIEI